MPGCALASLASCSGGGNVLVSWSRADSPSSRISLTAASIRACPAPTPSLPTPLDSGARSRRCRGPSTGVLTELEALEDEGRRHRRPDQRVAAERARRLPDTGVHHELGRLAGGDVGTQDLHVVAAVGPFAPQLQRIAVVEVP